MELFPTCLVLIELMQSNIKSFETTSDSGVNARYVVNRLYVMEHVERGDFAYNINFEFDIYCLSIF